MSENTSENTSGLVHQSTEDDVEGHLLRESPVDGIAEDGPDYERPR